MTGSSTFLHAKAVKFPDAIVCKPIQGFDRSKLPKRTKEEIETAKAVFKKESETFGMTANAVVSSDPTWKEYQVQCRMPCHKFVERLTYDQLSKCVFVTENGARRKSIFKPFYDKTDNGQPTRVKDTEAFLSWFLYYSPYGEFVLSRDDYEFSRDYGFVIEPCIPHPIFMNMLIITRHFYELQLEVFQKFTKLTTRKVDPIEPALAYSMIFNSPISAYKFDSYKNKLYMGYEGHRASLSYPLPALLNMYNGNPGHADMTKALKKTMATVKSVYGAKTLFHNTRDLLGFVDGIRYDEEFTKFLKETRARSNKDEQTLYKPPNPFVRVDPMEQRDKPTGTEFLFSELYDFVLDYLNKRIRREYNSV